MGVCAQQYNTTVNPKLKFDKSGYVKYIKFDGKNKTGKWNQPSSSTDFFADVLNADENDEFVLKNKRVQKKGSYTNHCRQTYKGVEVEGGLFILHFSNGRITKANGHYVNTDGVDPFPGITPDEAAQAYATYLNNTDNSSLNFIHGLVIAEIETFSGTDTTYKTRLCYKINIISNLANNGEPGYVDAHTGEILKTQRNWFNSSGTGTFTTMYSGTKSAGTQYYNGVYNLIDSSRNAVINTWDLGNNHYDTYLTHRDEFTDNDNNWTAAEHSDSNDQMGLDIHWALQEIYDYFDEEHGLQSFDGNNHMIDAFVHCYLPDGSGGWTKDNAGFNPFPSGDQVFFFGDGETTFKPLAALDVVAHEYAHAITHNHTGWTTLTTLRRAFHEGFSDIWGAVVENEVAPEKDHWKIGEEVIDVSGDDCLRNIANPESSTANMPISNCYNDPRYNDGGNDEAYEKSGVLSHWFYLLSEGGSGTNDNNDSYTVYGLGVDFAAEIVFDGQTTEFASVSSYTDARDAMIDAAEDIFDGPNTFQALQVEAAWYAVGVGSNPGQVTISGPGTVCYSGTTFTGDCPSGSTISWTTSSNLIVQSGGTTTTPTICAKYSTSVGEGWVQANFTSNGYTTPGPRKTVWVGPPSHLYMWQEVIEGYDPLCAGKMNGITIKNQSVLLANNITEYTWDMGNWSNYFYTYGSGDPTHSSAYFNIPQSADGTFNVLHVTATNTCGSSNPISMGYYLSACYGYSLAISPNPTTDEATVAIENTTEGGELLKSASPEATFDETAEWDIEVYDNMQSLKLKRQKLKGSSTRINTQSWKEGVYMVRVKYNDEILTGKLIVKK